MKKVIKNLNHVFTTIAITLSLLITVDVYANQTPKQEQQLGLHSPSEILVNSYSIEEILSLASDFDPSCPLTCDREGSTMCAFGSLYKCINGCLVDIDSCLNN